MDGGKQVSSRRLHCLDAKPTRNREELARRLEPNTALSARMVSVARTDLQIVLPRS
jgi:hypothetical protein